MTPTTGRKELQRWLLGDEADRRFRQDNAFVLATGYFYAVCAAAVLHGQTQGILPPGRGSLMAAGMALTWAAIYALVRSGWSRRLRDPSLSLPHALAAMTLMGVGYALAGRYRSNAFPLFALAAVLVMFRLSPRQIVAMGALACAILAAAMLWTAQQADGRERSVLAVQYVLASASIVAMALVARSVGSLRQHRVVQRRALAEALARAEELAVRDALTGAFNRHCMEEALQDRACEAPPRSVALALIDVDFFKAVNDTYGHRVGDEVLRGLVREAQAALREGDLLARWGGEEFLLMLPGRDLQEALACVEGLRGRVRELALSPSAAALRVSFSAGVALWHPGETPEHAIDRADRALYAAKQAGRDRCRGAEAGFEEARLQPA